MTLLAKLNSLDHEASKTDPCTMGQIIAGLDSESAKVLQRLVFNPKVSVRKIYELLKEENFRIERTTISNHRNGYCRCKFMGEEK